MNQTLTQRVNAALMGTGSPTMQNPVTATTRVFLSRRPEDSNVTAPISQRLHNRKVYLMVGICMLVLAFGVSMLCLRNLDAEALPPINAMQPARDTVSGPSDTAADHVTPDPTN